MKIVMSCLLFSMSLMLGCSSADTNDQYLKRGDSTLSKSQPREQYEPMERN